MTDAQLQGTFWPTLNPDYRVDPDLRYDGTPTDRFYDSVYYKDLTPEFLVRECIKRGWSSLPGRLNWWSEDEGIGWLAECRIPSEGNEWQVYFVSNSSGDPSVDGEVRERTSAGIPD